MKVLVTGLVGFIGPAISIGLLDRIDSLAGIDNIVLEKQSREYVIGRVRAGVLENGTIEMLRLAGVSDRLEKEGFEHNGIFYLLEIMGLESILRG